MSDRVNAQMDAVKLAARPATARSRRADTGGTKVLSRNKTVLPSRQFSEERVGWCRSVAAGAIV